MRYRPYQSFHPVLKIRELTLRQTRGKHAGITTLNLRQSVPGSARGLPFKSHRPAGNVQSFKPLKFKAELSEPPPRGATLQRGELLDETHP